jgi:hypothetical protein
MAGKEASMKKRIVCAISALLYTLAITPVQAQDACGGALTDLNSETHDYRPLIIYGDSRDYLYFTSARDSLDKGRGVKKVREAKMYVAERDASARKRGSVTPITSGWSEPRRVVMNDKLVNAYTQGALTYNERTNLVVFAAERPLERTSSTSYNMDLWVATLESADKLAEVDPSKASPLVNVNRLESWESQPAFHPEGNVLFFVSNRDVKDSNDLNIFYTVRGQDGTWGSATLLREITTRGREMSPFVSADGRHLYFSSDWNYDRAMSGSNGRDIWRVEIRVEAGEEGADVVRVIGAPQNLDVVLQSSRLVAGQDRCLDKVNSPANDEFPFLTPDGKYLLFTSDRDGGKGQRDNYAYGLPQPRICMRVEIEEQVFDQHGLLLRSGAVMRDVEVDDMQLGRTERLRSGGPELCVDPNQEYVVRYNAPGSDCGVTSTVDVPERRIRTGSSDSTIVVRYVVRTSCPPPPPAADLSDASAGVPYYITGYWMPNTSKNLEAFRNEWRNDRSALKWVNPGESDPDKRQSKFVDPYDLRAGDDFTVEQTLVKMRANDDDFGLYQSSASRVEQFLDEKVYRGIEQAIAAMGDSCCATRALKITVHGFTDACGLKPGTYEGPDVEVGTAVPPMFGIDPVAVPGGKRLVIRGGHDMRRGTVSAPDGSAVALADGGQSGNVALSMLRAAGMAQTIRISMEHRSERFRKMMDDGRIVFETMGYGVFDRAGVGGGSGKGSSKPCGATSTLALDIDGANGPRKAERCNVPEHRRIMVYFSYVDSVAVAAGHTLDVCGQPEAGYVRRVQGAQKKYEDYIAERRRMQDAQDNAPKASKPELAVDVPAPIVPGTENSYVVEYVVCNSEADADAARALMAALGVAVVEKQQTDGERLTWRFVSTEFADKDAAMMSYNSVTQRFASLRKALSTSKVRRAK